MLPKTQAEGIEVLKSREGKPNYKYKDSIEIRSSLAHNIELFDSNIDPLASLKEGQPITIELKGADDEYLEGKYHASSFDASAFSGHSPIEPPEDSLLANEYGRFRVYFSNIEAPEINLYLYLPHNEINKLIKRILESNATNLKVMLDAAIELFQNQTDASINYEWPIQDYGLICKSKDSGVSVAKFEAIELSVYGTHPTEPKLEVSDKTLKSTNKYWRVLALAVLLITYFIR